MEKNPGFTLIEVAIVIIAVGLIIGGVLVGVSLIESARIQATVSDMLKYKEAAINFKEKYYYYPGDMPNATSYWASAINGDGNNRITAGTACGGTNALCYTGGTSGENAAATQALSLAGFTSGNYTGSLVSTTPHLVGGTNFPKALFGKIDRSVSVGPYYAPVYVLHYSYLGTTPLNRNVFTISDFNATYFVGGVNPVDALAIDTKMDDGYPTTGEVRAFNVTIPAGTSTCYSGTTYPTTNGTGQCVVSELID